jgi:hypothetical protein
MVKLRCITGGTERQADWMTSPLDGYVADVFASVRTLVARGGS